MKPFADNVIPVSPTPRILQHHHHFTQKHNMDPRRLRIAALGSSFAAGPGIQPIIDKGAMRSGNNYAHQLAVRLNADLTDLTVSGATLLNVLNEVQEFRGNHFEPQLDRLPKDADIVTLTGGGNDLGYSMGMMLDSALSYTGPLQGLLRRQLGPAPTTVDGEQLAQRFIRVIDKIQELVPKAKIYLVEYLTVFGDATQPGQGTPLSQEAIQKYRDQETVLIGAYASAAKARPNIELIAMSKQSKGHEIGTTEPWMLGFAFSMFWQGLMPYHPNIEGHTAAADALYHRISGSGPE